MSSSTSSPSPSPSLMSSSSSSSSKLRLSLSSPYMSLTDSRNPYGPNYSGHAYDTKVFNKFNSVKRFVHMEEKDQKTLLYGNVAYFFGLFGAFLGGATISIVLKKMVLKLKLKKINELIEDYHGAYFSAFTFSATLGGYWWWSNWYVLGLCEPLLGKYLEEAKRNGFENYEIS